MAFAILKLSYNSPNDTELVGGLCGTGFFVAPGVAITAHHVLNAATFLPNEGLRHARLWLVSPARGAIPLLPNCVEVHPEIDVTVLRISTFDPLEIYRIAETDAIVGADVRAVGYLGNVMPPASAEWAHSEIVIRRVDLRDVVIQLEGRVRRLLTFDVNASDVKMRGVSGFDLSFPSHVGMSGGPVLAAGGVEVVGVLSFGLPADERTKTMTFAVSASVIVDVLRGS